MTVFGPDVSAWQEGLVPPDPPGIAFGIARATNGQAVDPVVDNVIAWCKARKVPFCAYHFVYEVASHPAAAQAAAFHKAVGSDKTIPCMLDWETDHDDNCHPGRPQHPKWNDCLAVAAEIRKLGHKVPLLYTNYYYWKDDCGSPTLTGQGFDLVNANYDNSKTGSATQIYAARGGDSGPGWNGYGGLTPVLWQFTDKATWGNKQLDMNAYRGDPTVLHKWFTTWTGGAVAEVLYLYGWQGSKVTMAQLEAKETIRNAHPEFWRRTKPMLVEGKGRLGVGCIWRSSDIQRNTFLARHYAVASGGCCSYQGRRYRLRKGMAHAAPPGKSFHESTFHGYAAAADMVGDLAWMHSVEAKYGLKDFRNVGSEPWHTQFAETANSVTQWIAAGRPRPKVWDLPGAPTTKPPTTTPAPKPPPLSPIQGDDEMILMMRYGGTASSGWGGWASLNGGASRRSVTGPQADSMFAGDAYDGKTLAKVTNWNQVTHTTNAGDLDTYLGS